MNDQLLTIALLIIVVCNLGVLLLYWRIYEWTQTPAELYSLWERIEKQNRLILDRLSVAADRQRDMNKGWMAGVGPLTLERIAQVKTRLADKERQDQREKRHARSQRQR